MDINKSANHFILGAKHKSSQRQANKTMGLFKSLALFSLSLFLFSCGSLTPAPSSNVIFTDPTVKLAELNSQEFTQKLYYEALALEPALDDKGTKVHIGFWSLGANRPRLMALLDDINNYVSIEVHCGIWDEGTTTLAASQYPSYILMNKEHWYERAYPLADGTVSIEGVHYIDPYPVTTIEADLIWGAYSQRYADMAKLFCQATGTTVEAWCFVQGARRARIFYSFELSTLASLETAGYVYVHFATTYEASWQNKNQWITGTTNAPTPES